MNVLRSGLYSGAATAAGDFCATARGGAANTAPANTPEPIVQRIYQAVRTILNDPATQSVWTDKGMMVPEDISPAAYRTEIGERIQFYQRIAKANNIVAE